MLLSLDTLEPAPPFDPNDLLADDVVGLLEAEFVDQHPRWPAGTPGGLGGKFKKGLSAASFQTGSKHPVAGMSVGQHFVGKKGTLYRLTQKSEKTTWAKAINLDTGKPYPVQHHQEFHAVPHTAVEYPSGAPDAPAAPATPAPPAAATPSKEQILAGLKKGEMWPARSNTGGLRNFGAMSQGKLTKTAHDLVFEREHGGTHDPHAEAAVAAELDKRGLPAEPGLGDAPSGPTQPLSRPEAAPSPDALAGQLEKSVADHHAGLAVGDHVTHPEFGDGIVDWMAASGKGKITVDFGKGSVAVKADDLTKDAPTPTPSGAQVEGILLPADVGDGSKFGATEVKKWKSISQGDVINTSSGPGRVTKIEVDPLQGVLGAGGSSPNRVVTVEVAGGKTNKVVVHFNYTIPRYKDGDAAWKAAQDALGQKTGGAPTVDSLPLGGKLEVDGYHVEYAPLGGTSQLGTYKVTKGGESIGIPGGFAKPDNALQAIADHKAGKTPSGHKPAEPDSFKVGDQVTWTHEDGETQTVTVSKIDPEGGYKVTDSDGTEWGVDDNEIAPERPSAPDTPPAESAPPAPAAPALKAIDPAAVEKMKAKLAPSKLVNHSESGGLRNVTAMSDVKLVATAQHPHAEGDLVQRVVAELNDRGYDENGKPLAGEAPSAVGGQVYALKPGDTFHLDGEKHTVTQSNQKTTQKTIKATDASGKEVELPADTIYDAPSSAPSASAKKLGDLKPGDTFTVPEGYHNQGKTYVVAGGEPVKIPADAGGPEYHVLLVKNLDGSDAGTVATSMPVQDIKPAEDKPPESTAAQVKAVVGGEKTTLGSGDNAKIFDLATKLNATDGSEGIPGPAGGLGVKMPSGKFAVAIGGSGGREYDTAHNAAVALYVGEHQPNGKLPANAPKPPAAPKGDALGDAVEHGGLAAYGSAHGPGGKYKHPKVSELAFASMFVDKNGKAWVVTKATNPDTLETMVSDGKSHYTIDGKLRVKSAENSSLGTAGVAKLLQSQKDSKDVPAPTPAAPKPTPPKAEVAKGHDVKDWEKTQGPPMGVEAMPLGTHFTASTGIWQKTGEDEVTVVAPTSDVKFSVNSPTNLTSFGGAFQPMKLKGGPATPAKKAPKAIKGKQPVPPEATGLKAKTKDLHLSAGDVVQVVKGGHNLTLVEPVGDYGGWKVQKPGGGTKVLYGHVGLATVVKADGSKIQTKADAGVTAAAGGSKPTVPFLKEQLSEHTSGTFGAMKAGTVFKTLDGKLAVLDPSVPAYTGYISAWTEQGTKVEVPEGVPPSQSSNKPIPGALDVLKALSPDSSAPTAVAPGKAAAQKAVGTQKKIAVADTWAGIPNGQAAKQKIAGWQQGTHSKLSADQIAELEGYTDGTYSKINTALRQEDLDAYTLQKVERLDSVFNTIDGIPEDIITHRGTSAKALVGKLEPGKVIYDRGYMSTSPTKPWSKDVVLHIRLKKGSKALWGPTSGGDVTAGEDEIILRRATMMHVLQVEKTGGTTHVYVEAYA